MGRATAALESKGQKVDSLRFANIDVMQLTGLQEMNVYAMREYATAAQTVEVLPARAAAGELTKSLPCLHLRLSLNRKNQRQHVGAVRVPDSVKRAVSSRKENYKNLRGLTEETQSRDRRRRVKT